VLMSEQIRTIKNETIEEAFQQSDRQYLVGNLARPQILQHVTDEDVEIGISDYKEDSFDQPHFHPCLSEYQYVLKGEIIVFDLENELSYTLREGDFYSVPASNRRVQVSKKDSRILFVKNTSKDDKTVVELTDKERRWMENIWKESSR